MKNRKRMVRAVAIFLAALMLFSLVFSAVGSIFAHAADRTQLDDLEAEKESIREEKKEAAAAANNLRDQQASYEEQKKVLDEKLTLAQEEINLTKEQIAIYEELVREKQLEADEAQALVDKTLAQYKAHVRAMEENGTSNFYFSVLFGAENFSDLLSRIDMITEIMEYEKALERKYKAARDEALTAKAEYQQLCDEMEAKKAELEQEVQELEKEIEEAKAKIAEIEKQIKEYERLYNAAVASEAAVAAKINQILKEIAEAEAAAKAEEEKRKEEESQGGSSGDNSSGNSGGTSTGGNSGGTTGGTTVGGTNFTWPTPSCRYVTSPYGNRVHPVLGNVRFHSGIDIGASSGSAIVASESGTVILVGSDPSGYGNYVVINHGGGYTTLYAHLSSIGVGKGQTVSRGQTIGTVGMTGLSTGPHLHFEIRVNGSTTDPLGYFSGYTILD